MLELVSMLPLIYAAVVCACCTVLLVRGVRFAFVMFFGAGALLQFLLRLGVLLAYPTSGSHGPLSRDAIRALAFVGPVSTLLFGIGWISLTAIMLKAQRTSREDGTSSV